MGKKKDRNAPAPAAKVAKTAKASKGFNPWIGGAILVAVVGVGALVLSGGTDEAASPSRRRRPPEADPRARRPCRGNRQPRAAQAGVLAADSVPGLRAAALGRSRHRGVPVRRRAPRDPELRARASAAASARATAATTTASSSSARPTATSSSGTSTASSAPSASTWRTGRGRCIASGASVRDIRAAIDKEFGAQRSRRAHADAEAADDWRARRALSRPTRGTTARG